jgi:hypothetical protein
MRAYLSVAERRAEKKEIARLKAEQRKDLPGIKMSENQWRELRFTGRVRDLGIIILGDVATRQHYTDPNSYWQG